MVKKIIFMLAVIIGSMALVQGQQTVKGSGYILMQQRKIELFRFLEVSSRIKVFIVPGKFEPVTVEADNNLFNYIKTEVRNDTLRIFVPDSIDIRKYGVMNVLMSIPEVSGLKASGASYIDGSQKPWPLSEILLEVSDTSRIDWHTNAGKITVTAYENSSVLLKGTTPQLNVALFSGSRLDAHGLKAINANFIMENHTEAKVDVSSEISYKLINGGKLIYTGQPKITESSTENGGQAIRRK